MKNKNEKKSLVKSALIFKHGAYNTALVAIVLVAIIALNVLFTALCNRFPLQLDLTLSAENTLSQDNIDYLKKNVNRDVNVVLCATEDGYVDGYMAWYASNNYNAQDQTGKYYAQALKLLESYEKYNSHIKFSYADPDAVSFSAVQEKVDTTLGYGDVLVYSSYEKDGKTVTNTKVLQFDDLYELSEESSYFYGSSYTVSGSNVESAVTGAIAAVMIDDVKNVALVTGHGTEGAFDDFSAVLQNNGFKTTKIEDKVLKEIPADTDVVVIAGAESDFTAAELELLESFLDNDGKKGKNLAVFCNYAANTPLFNEFLAEWGVSCESGSVVYETDEDNIYYDNTLLYATNQKTEFTEDVNESQAYYLSVSAVPMTAAYTNYGNRAATVLMATSDTCVSAPVSELLAASEAEEIWEPDSSYKPQSFATAILTRETVYAEDATYMSNVVVFSDVTFISDLLASDPFGNSAFAASAFKTMAGTTATSVYFMAKSVATYQFVESPTATATTIMRIIFLFLLPVGIIGAGCFIWFRRKRR